MRRFLMIILSVGSIHAADAFEMSEVQQKVCLDRAIQDYASQDPLKLEAAAASAQMSQKGYRDAFTLTSYARRKTEAINGKR
jgi:hypothetical protein